jgi:hypothetical protein
VVTVGATSPISSPGQRQPLRSGLRLPASVENCAKTGTILLTIIAGPLNYVGLNRKIESCEVPQPSE